MKNKFILLSFLTAGLFSPAAFACDQCACETPLIRLANRSGWFFGVGEQFTHFGTLQLAGGSIADPVGQYLDSSITQSYVGYHFSQSFGLQINVPLIHRSFRRVEGGMVDNGRVAGFGDVSMLAYFTPFRMERGDFLATARLLAGVKLPTGDPERLREEAAEMHGEEEGEHAHEDAELPPSGIHGHDLALGTGSLDGVFGGEIHLQWRRWFVDAGLQFVLRGCGRFEYDFGDELNWNASVGAVAIEREKFNVAVALAFTGMTKEEDAFRGVKATDTAATTVFVGPRVVAVWNNGLHADVGAGFPILRENSSVQVVPDLRIQASIGWQF